MSSKQLFEEEIHDLLLLNEDELYLQLGEEISPALGLLDSAKKSTLIKIAQEWMNKQRKSFQLVICKSSSLSYYLTDTEKFDKIITIASIVDLISSIKFNVSPVVVAVLIFKEGIKSFCANSDNL